MKHFKKHLKKHSKEYFTESLKYDFKEEAARSGILLGAFQIALHVQLQTFQEFFLGSFRFFQGIFQSLN